MTTSANVVEYTIKDKKGAGQMSNYKATTYKDKSGLYRGKVIVYPGGDKALKFSFLVDGGYYRETRADAIKDAEIEISYRKQIN